MRIIVIAGTDTGVGKTYVAGNLARLLNAVAIKLIETGSDEDGTALARATGQHAPAHALLRLRDPLAPAVAADREGVTIDMASLLSQVTDFAGTSPVVVEGAGGVLTPLTWTETIVDVKNKLGAKAVLVAQDRLGTLAHVRAACDILEPIAVVLSAPAADDESTGTNLTALLKLIRVPVFAIERHARSEALQPLLDLV